MSKAYYSASIRQFLEESQDSIVGKLNSVFEFDREINQGEAWIEEIAMLKEVLAGNRDWGDGSILFEYTIPRLCGRIDAVVLLGQKVFAIEFKVGEKSYPAEAKKQVLHYCLDLKYFHRGTKTIEIVPVLVCTNAKAAEIDTGMFWEGIHRITCVRNAEELRGLFENTVSLSSGQIALDSWVNSKYEPTPTIIEAAIALYEHHDVRDITKTSDDENATNLTTTTTTLRQIIAQAREKREKAICFVTGVPGAGKTLVGLNLATDRELNREPGTRPVFLSGNGPLVEVLQKALQRDAKKRKKLISNLLKAKGGGVPPDEVKQYFSFAINKTFVQDVFGFRKNYLEGGESDCRVAIFDEAQRAWTLSKMRRKAHHNEAEPTCLIRQLDKNEDWAVIVCLVGNGQEIHDGEAGIVEWLKSLNDHFPHWKVHLSGELELHPERFDVDREEDGYTVATQIRVLKESKRLSLEPSLHLGVNLRSFRSENVSALANAIVDCRPEDARELLGQVLPRYPIVLTRDLDKAKEWVRAQSKRVDRLYLERFGLLASSGALRIRPEGILVPVDMKVATWFLGEESEVDSSFYLELAASEFKVQGLEIDYAILIWEADYRYQNGMFSTHRFVGEKWTRVKDVTRKNYLKNAYRVLLTRARQGFVIYIPKGNVDDHTRNPEFYDTTYKYLSGLGIPILG